MPIASIRLAAATVLALSGGAAMVQPAWAQQSWQGGVESAPLAPPANVPNAPALPAPVAPPQTQPGGAGVPSIMAPPLTAPGAATRPPLPQGVQPGVAQPGAVSPGAVPPPGQSAVPLEQGEVQVVQPPSQKIANKTAVFNGLDKITGRIITFDAAIGETVQFGTLQVTPRVCYTRPATETQNTTGFVDVNEITLKNETRKIFGGWMFASSPGLHGVEHPIYDVWLIDCKQTAPVIATPGAQP